MIEAVDHWGKGAPRRIESDASWNTPLAWDRKAQADGVRSPFSAGPSVTGRRSGTGERTGTSVGPYPANHASRLAIPYEGRRADSSLPPRGLGRGLWQRSAGRQRRRPGAHALARLDVLREIPPPVRFALVEPPLEDLGEVDLLGIPCVITNGESFLRHQTSSLSILQSIRYKINCLRA